MLMWLITFPGQDPVSVIYNNSIPQRVDVLDMNITTVVINNEMGDYIESLLIIAILPNVSMNGTQVVCTSEGLSEMATVYVNTSGMSDLKNDHASAVMQ